MKFRNKLIFFIILFMVYINPIYASSKISLDCPLNGLVNDTISCNVYVDSDVYISAVSTKLNLSSNLELVKYTTDPEFLGIGDNGDIELYTYPNKIGKFSLGVALIKIKDNSNSNTGTIILENTKFYIDDYSEIIGNSDSFNVKILSSNNYLSSIKINNGTLMPSFNRDVLTYNVTTDKENITILATLEDDNAKVENVGIKELKYGINTIIITVTSESGMKKEYQLIVNRIKKEEEKVEIPVDDNEDKSDNSFNDNKIDLKLKELVIDGYTIDFKENIYDYTINLVNDNKKLNIKAIPIIEDIKVSIEGNDNFIEGINKIIITLKDDFNNRNIYTINVIKENSICILDNINISGYKINFNCNKYEYSLGIGKEDKLDIDVITKDKDTKVDILNNNNLKNNDIIVISINDGEYKYQIRIIKEENNFNNKIILGLTILLIFSISYLLIRMVIKKNSHLVN